MTSFDDAPVVLRAAAEHECPILVEILREAFGDVARSLGITEQSRPEFPAFETVERLRARVRERGWRMCLLMQGDTPVGCGAYSVDPSDPTLGGIHRVALRLSCQSRGYGVRLVRGLEDLLRAAGARRVRLMHTAENVQLHRFYLRLGYEPVGEDPAPDGGFGTIYMERDL